jgi:hypothetical protein
MSAFGPNNDVSTWGKVVRSIQSLQPYLDTAAAIARGGRYGEVCTELVTAKAHKGVDEGSYYLATTPTPGTGIASITAPTAYVATSPYIIVTNNNPVGSGKNIWMDYIHLLLVTPGTSSTNLSFTSCLDVISRYASGGNGGNNTGLTTILQGPFCPNSGALGQSQALVYGGALVAVAASLQQKIVVPHRFLRTAIAVANDSYLFNFGATDAQLDSVLISGAAIVQRNIPHPAVCVAPGGSYLFHLYGAAMAAATTCEVEVGYFER